MAGAVTHISSAIASPASTLKHNTDVLSSSVMTLRCTRAAEKPLSIRELATAMKIVVIATNPNSAGLSNRASTTDVRNWIP